LLTVKHHRIDLLVGRDGAPGNANLS